MSEKPLLKVIAVSQKLLGLLGCFAGSLKGFIVKIPQFTNRVANFRLVNFNDVQ